MLRPRVIPTLLLKGKGLVKGQNFKNHVYVGDPVNAVQIFNRLEADEIIFLDILATNERRIPDISLIHRIADRCLLPFSIGGGIRSINDAEVILRAGAEKVCIGSAVTEVPGLVESIAKSFGSQSVIGVIDFKKSWLGNNSVFIRSGQKNTHKDVLEYARALEESGAGEILLCSIDREGGMMGYDLGVLNAISDKIRIPIIVSGGAGTNQHLREGLRAGAAAAAAGSLFVFQGPRRGVLINYPSPEERAQIST